MFNRILLKTVIILGLMLFTINSSYAVPNVSITGSGGPLYVGSFFDIFVELQNVPSTEPLIGFEFYVSAPTEWVLDSIIGDPDFDLLNVSSNYPTVIGTSLNGDSGNIIIATLRYKAPAAGNFNFSIASDTNNPTDGLTYDCPGFPNCPVNDDISAFTSITIQQSVPEPATLILIGSGMLTLAGIAFRQRKNKK